jgi:hypothetical protein
LMLALAVCQLICIYLSFFFHCRTRSGFLESQRWWWWWWWWFIELLLLLLLHSHTCPAIDFSQGDENLCSLNASLLRYFSPSSLMAAA